ncbi:MAG: hypothetical protein D6772_03950, partial [Bacteroidetes bacterium]
VEKEIFTRLKEIFKAPLGDRKSIWIKLQRKLWALLPKDGTMSTDQSLTTFISWLDNRLGKYRG